jgi:hypothetical protein
VQEWLNLVFSAVKSYRELRLFRMFGLLTLPVCSAGAGLIVKCRFVRLLTHSASTLQALVTCLRTI